MKRGVCGGFGRRKKKKSCFLEGRGRMKNVASAGERRELTLGHRWGPSMTGCARVLTRRKIPTHFPVGGKWGRHFFKKGERES